MFATIAATVVGRTVSAREAVCGLVRIATRAVDGTSRPSLKVASIVVENTTPWNARRGADRDAAMRRSLVAVHTLLAVDDGSFVSLLDPPPTPQQAVAGCANDGTFPVLVGDEATDDVMLSSPIILYDFPASPRRAPATSATRPRSTRSSRCGS